LKTCTVYPRAHPRVHDAAIECVQQVGVWIEAPPWLRMRVRGSMLLLGDVVVENPSPLVQWLLGRLLDNALAGLEFGPAFDEASAIELGFTFGSSSSRHGRTFAAQWQRAHPSVRPLDLVFEGQHLEEGTLAVGTATQGDDKNTLLQRLAGLPRVRELMRAIETNCARGTIASETSARMDVLAGIVDLLPAEVVRDAAAAEAVVERVLTEVETGIVRVLHREVSIDDAEITRTALNVAKKYFTHIAKAETPVVQSARLAAGRPEDEAITADLGLLVAEVGRLPRDPNLRLPTATAASSSPEQTAELLGIYLQVLRNTERPETLRALATCLPKVLHQVDEPRLRVLDRHLEPAGSAGVAALADDRRLELLGILERSGQAGLVSTRGYVDAGLIVRTFPLSLPLLARLLDHEHGRPILAEGLRRIGPQRMLTGADVLRAKGLLAEPGLLSAIAGVGGELVLPLVRRLAFVETPAAKALVVDYLRRLPLPQFESAALRHVEPATQLPGSYLESLLRMVADRSRTDSRIQEASGMLLRRHVTEAMADLPLGRQLAVIRGLGDVPGPETMTLARTLSRAGGILCFTSSARARRKQAREVLRRLSLEAITP
jgi:hypothetical protein